MHVLQEPNQLSPLVWPEVPQSGLGHRPHLLIDSRLEFHTSLRQAYADEPPVGCMRPPFNEACCFHPARHLGHRRGSQAQPASNLTGRLAVLAPEHPEDVLLPGANSVPAEGGLARLDHRPFGVPERGLEIVVELISHLEYTRLASR